MHVNDLENSIPDDLVVDTTKYADDCAEDRAVARTLIGGGGVYIHIFGFCPTDFF